MSNTRTNKSMKQLGDFETRMPKPHEFSEYIYRFADGTESVISRSELAPEVDALLYGELKLEANNNEVQLEKHRGIDKNQEELLSSQPAEDDVEQSVIRNIDSRELYKAISSLQPQQQALLTAKHIQNKSNTAIASEEGVTEAAIRARLKKIYKKLKNILR